MLMSDEKRYALLTRGLFRHVFDCDPIPSLPPAEAGSFVHTGVELRTPVPLPDQPTWRRQAHTVKRTPMRLLSPVGVTICFVPSTVMRTGEP